ncbi:patatin-like phospholipase family protein [Bradyrhizobium zhanjiangense]|uniref:PNPLA domain-containing protein n=1 Tax=Bradyrhizobium zhanjiangense TaxID=1325107 RepID=A0A4Q0Q8F4_9BRAD|nr:hypothetical protein EAS61_37190 [Bradyrhizobium zhanjiangense]
MARPDPMIDFAELDPQNSGGGLRATFFHLGVIRILRRLNLLHKVTHVISVSGGSIAATQLVRHWKLYTGTPDQFDAAQSDLLSLRDWDIRGNVLRRALLWWPIYFLSLRFPQYLSRLRVGRTELLNREYDRYFGGLTLDGLRRSSEGSPQFHLVSTNLVTGSICSFTKRHYVIAEDGQLKPYSAELTKVSMAVTASSAFPPVFPPIRFDESMTGGKSGAFRGYSHFLTDGGVYDNTGYESAALLETDLKSKGTKLGDLIIVSDAGSPFQWRYDSEFTNPFSLAARASEIVMNRVAEEMLKRIVSQERIALVSIDDIDEDDSLSPMIQRATSRIRTDLDRFSAIEVAALVTHGENKAARQLQRHSQINSNVTPSSTTTNVFPIQLPPAEEVAGGLSKSWQLRWWNSFTNFSDWRTALIYLIALALLVGPTIGITAAFSYWVKQLEQKSAAQAAAMRKRRPSVS